PDCFFALKVWNVRQANASAVLVADDIEEALITMDNPEEDSSSAKYIENITFPSSLIEKTFGETLTLMIVTSTSYGPTAMMNFTPHYITWYCPQAFTLSRQCKSQCINRGRYCAPDPEQGFSSGYEGKDVVIETLRQLCVFKVANETNRPWVWWDYVADFQIRRPMKEKKYNKECADGI
ncbi:hypothetical protein Goshw_008926, partial [Gossypium schwendimanii]|nr:hypothetical protein [Gossypium schwendimanii]